MLDQFQAFISENNLCEKGDRILVAVSGGVDSVVLLDLFHRSGYDIAAAHCNFGLRGSESDEEEQFVSALAADLQIECFVKKFQTASFAEEKQLSIQEAARILRYDWFESLSREEGFDRIAVAHHADDSAETFFINFLRGSGFKGLKGIPVQRGRIIRPLLFATKKELNAYAEKRALGFRIDSSNLSDKYLRNRIRNELIPLFGQLDERSAQGIQKSLSILNEDYLLLTQLIDEKRKSMIIRNGEYLTISLADLLSLQPLSTWSYYLLFPFGFNRAITDSIARSSEQKESGKLFNSSTHQLLVDREHLIIRDRIEDKQDEPILIQAADRKVEAPVQLNIRIHDPAEVELTGDGKTTAWFDFDKLTFPLKIRKWKQGDRFVPFGMTGSKLVSDYLADEKVNLFEKEKVYVLLSGQEIMWVIGHRSSDSFRISGETKKVFQVHFSG